MASDPAPGRITHIDFSPDTVDPQARCPLFTVLPGEVRDRILHLALAEYEDPSAAHPGDTVYARPDFAFRRRTDAAVLRTCKRVYREAWFRPWTLAEQVLFFTGGDRRPRRVTTVADVRDVAALIHRSHGEDVVTEQVRVFAQLCRLEDGQSWRELLGVEHFHPRRITVTLRHTDWWYWESDTLMGLRGDWVSVCDLPASVRELRVELESLERKSGQVDQIAEQMASRWTFVRADGVLFSAEPPKPAAKDAGEAATEATGDDEDDAIRRWTGSSIWHDQRWVRDEVRPGELDYYVRTVTWRPTAARRKEGAERPAAAALHATGEKLAWFQPPYLDMNNARRLGVDLDGLPGPEAARRLIEAMMAERAARPPQRIQRRRFGLSSGLLPLLQPPQT